MKIDNKVIVKFLICIIATLAIITLKNNKFYWELDNLPGSNSQEKYVIKIEKGKQIKTNVLNLKYYSNWKKINMLNKYDHLLDYIENDLTKYFSQNLILRNYLVLISGLLLDLWFIVFLFVYCYRGTGFKEMISFIIFYGIRALFMSIFEFDYPLVNLHEENPGFFSLVAPHGRSADFFYSGHTGFSLLCTLFMWEYEHKFAFALGMLSTFFQIFFITITRSHYCIDAWVGFIMAHYIYLLSTELGSLMNTFFPILGDNKYQLFKN